MAILAKVGIRNPSDKAWDGPARATRYFKGDPKRKEPVRDLKVKMKIHDIIYIILYNLMIDIDYKIQRF